MAIKIRCKFFVSSITDYGHAAKTVKFQAAYDNGIPENERFYNSTPSGSLEILTNNAEALEQFVIGIYHYLDLTLCE